VTHDDVDPVPRPLGYAVFPTALGSCGIVWDASGAVVGSTLPDGGADQVRRAVRRWYPGAVEAEPPAPVADAAAAVGQLLDRGHADLSGVTLSMAAVPDFDRRVYEVVRDIPPGQTLTYGDVAARLGAPGSAQAVGQALGRNPFPPIVPCHRVVAAGRKIGGFSARGGPRTKLRMLATEGVHLEQPTLFDL
jgi:methylated-DNA-[protein]-cysteine S-methyltransferase